MSLDELAHYTTINKAEKSNQKTFKQPNNYRCFLVVQLTASWKIADMDMCFSKPLFDRGLI